MVTAARWHLTIAHATGVDRLLWDTEKRPMPDLDAVQAVISPHKANQPVEALDIGAALILVQEMRLEVDCLEAEVLAAALDSGLGLESLAAVLELPGPAAMLARLEYIVARSELPRPDPRSATPEKSPDSGVAKAGAQAARRAEQAAMRAASAARRREELRAGQRRASRADVDRAAARANEARIAAGDAAERVASGLLRAANALDGCAEKCLENEGADRDPVLSRRAQEYTSAARRYREMAASYLDIGKHV